MENTQNKKIDFIAIIGAFAGGIIGTIPWILLAIFARMQTSLLAICISYGAIYGYKLMNGKINKSTPAIIFTVSILSVLIASLLLIPLAQLYKYGYQPTLYNVSILYNDKEYLDGMIIDTLFAVLFTYLGIRGVVKNLKSEIAIQ